MKRNAVTIQKLDGSVIERNPYTAQIDASDIEKRHIPTLYAKRN